MANNLTANPWFIDTASANYLRSGVAAPAPGGLSGTASKGPLHLVAITFSNYTTGNTDKATIKDTNGNVIANLEGTSDKTIVGVTFPRDFKLWDLAVTTLSSGQVSIWLR